MDFTPPYFFILFILYFTTPRSFPYPLKLSLTLHNLPLHSSSLTLLRPVISSHPVILYDLLTSLSIRLRPPLTDTSKVIYHISFSISLHLFALLLSFHSYQLHPDRLWDHRPLFLFLSAIRLTLSPINWTFSPSALLAISSAHLASLCNPPIHVPFLPLIHFTFKTLLFFTQPLHLQRVLSRVFSFPFILTLTLIPLFTKFLSLVHIFLQHPSSSKL